MKGAGRRWRRTRLPFGETVIKVTVSIGIAIRAAGMTQYPDLLKIADQVMYAAKHCGRNVVRTCEDPAPAELWCDLPPAGAAKPSWDATPMRPPIDLQVVLKRCGGDAEFGERSHAKIPLRRPPPRSIGFSRR